MPLKTYEIFAIGTMNVRVDDADSEAEIAAKIERLFYESDIKRLRLFLPAIEKSNQQKETT